MIKHRQLVHVIQAASELDLPWEGRTARFKRWVTLKVRLCSHDGVTAHHIPPPRHKATVFQGGCVARAAVHLVPPGGSVLHEQVHHAKVPLLDGHRKCCVCEHGGICCRLRVRGSGTFKRKRKCTATHIAIASADTQRRIEGAIFLMPPPLPRPPPRQA